MTTATVERTAPGALLRGSIARRFRPALVSDGARWFKGRMEYSAEVRFPVLAEPKVDGYRCIAPMDARGVGLFSRQGKRFEHFEPIRDALAGMDLHGIVFDGEISDPSFAALAAIAQGAASPDGLTYNVFDILPLEDWLRGIGRDPQTVRTRTLHAMEWPDPRVRPVSSALTHSAEGLAALFCAVRAQGHEGLVLKAPDARYPFGNAHAWQRVKEWHSADCRITGTLEGKGRCAGALGAIIVDCDGVETSVGTGLDAATRAELWDLRDTLPGRVVEVKYQERTAAGALRFPSFLRLRPDK